MDRLTPLDNAFLEAENADPHNSLAIASVAIFEGPVPSYEEFVRAIAGRLPMVPRYRQKVRRVPLGLGAPMWVDDPDFNVRGHIGLETLREPGGDAELQGLTARLMSLRMDRDRPLWQLWLIDGLANDQWAVLSKVHHCMVDGIAGTDLYRVMLDLTPKPGPAVRDTWQPAPQPSALRVTATALRDLAFVPVDEVRSAVHLMRHPRRALRDITDAGKGLLRLGSVLAPASPSSLSGEIGARRRYTWTRASLDEVHLIREHLGGTVNDVVLAAITAGFRDLLISREEEPLPHSVRTLVPVSIRPPGAESITDNEITVILARLPVQLADPVDRLTEVRTELRKLKDSKEPEAGAAVTTLAKLEPFPLASWPVRAAFRYRHHGLVTVTTNVPGPTVPLYGMGRRVLEIAPYVPIANTLRIGVAIFSYDGKLTFGITADHDSTPDIEVLARGIKRGMADLVIAARKSARPLQIVLPDAARKRVPDLPTQAHESPVVDSPPGASVARDRAPGEAPEGA